MLEPSREEGPRGWLPSKIKTAMTSGHSQGPLGRTWGTWVGLRGEPRTLAVFGNWSPLAGVPPTILAACLYVITHGVN